LRIFKEDQRDVVFLSNEHLVKRECHGIYEDCSRKEDNQYREGIYRVNRRLQGLLEDG